MKKNIFIFLMGLSIWAYWSYKDFQKNARQKEGWSILTSLYTVAHSARANTGAFGATLEEIGFEPSADVIKNNKLTYSSTGQSFTATLEVDNVVLKIDDKRNLFENNKPLDLTK